jgi:hypothetical protein
VIELNRLSNPGEAAAFARLEAILERVDAAPLGQLALSRLAMPGSEEHAAMVAELETEADRCGRRELLDDVRDRVEADVIRRLSPFAYASRLAMYPVPIHSVARPDEEAVIVTAVVDAVSVALLEDRLQPRTAARLSRPGRSLFGLPPLDEREPPATADEPIVPEPSAADWAEAAAGDTRIGEDEPAPTTARVVLAAVVACTVGPVVLLTGIAGDNALMGVLGAIAVLAICWLLATFGRQPTG